MGNYKGSGRAFLGGILIFTAILFLFSFSLSFIASSEQSCQDIAPVTEFYPLTPTKIIIFDEGGSDSSTKILVPIGLQVHNASMKVMGIPILSQPIEKPADVAIINDVSGSMDEKIDETKEAAKNFIDVLLNNTENRAGLVSYSTQAVSWIGLTNDKVLLFDEIDSYVAMNETCVACGIVKGVEILQDSEKPVKAMLLMTDGKANRCTYGVCTPYMAKKQALNRAEWAWLNYNISIYTVSFSEDADIELLDGIARVSSGTYYHITWTDMTDIYYDIASETILSYPTNPAIDIGIDGSIDWSYPGELRTTEYFEFASGLQNLVDCDCPGCDVMGDDCLISLEVTSETAGMMILDRLNITGCLYEEIPPADHVVFSQVFYDTPGNDDEEEWFELYNPTQESVDLSGMKIYDNQGLGIEIPEGWVLESGKYITIARNATGFYNLYGCDADICGFNRDLGNGGDFLKLTNGDDIDFVAWENGTEGWDIFASENRSIIRDPAYIDTDSPDDWLSDQEAKPKCVREPPCYDNDEDGYLAEECGGDDCDDSNPDVNPGAEEVCNGIDDDCDDEIDEGVKNTYYFDSDNDGYGDPGDSEEACWPPEGFISDNTDCDDSNPDVNPGATEVCNGIDDNCNGQVDEGCGVTPPSGGPISTSGLSCMQEWECTEWSECINGEQTRTCDDRNNCPTDYLKPDETQECEVLAAEEEIPEIMCIEGTRTCVGDVLRECVENEWQDVETCQWGCEDGACGPEPEEVIEEEEGVPVGLVGLITGSPVAFWGIIVIILIILGGAYWKLRK